MITNTTTNNYNPSENTIHINNNEILIGKYLIILNQAKMFLKMEAVKFNDIRNALNVNKKIIKNLMVLIL